MRQKTKRPAPADVLGQEKSCGATRLDAVRPLKAYFSYADPLTVGRPSHIRKRTPQRVALLLALGSPFHHTCSIAIPPPATLWGVEMGCTHSSSSVWVIIAHYQSFVKKINKNLSNFFIRKNDVIGNFAQNHRVCFCTLCINPQNLIFLPNPIAFL